MKKSYPHRVRPIAWLASKSEAILSEVAVNDDPVIITQNGVPVLALLEIAEYEKQTETIALMRLSSIGSQQRDAGKSADAEEFLAGEDD